MLLARMKKIQSKMKALDWLQHFSHFKSMGIFQDAQGKVTHKSLVGPADFQTHLSVYGCPCYMKE